MNNDTDFLTIEQVLGMHEDLIEKYGGIHGIRDLTLLESAIYRAQVTFGGEELYPTIYYKAAVLLHSILLNHPFLDGNKRTSIASALTFLHTNGKVIITTQGELINFALDIESKNLKLEQIARWLEEHAEK